MNGAMEYLALYSAQINLHYIRSLAIIHKNSVKWYMTLSMKYFKFTCLKFTIKAIEWRNI